MRIKLCILSVLICSSIWECTPKSSGPEQNTSAKAKGVGASGGLLSAGDGKTSVTSSATGTSTSNSTGTSSTNHSAVGGLDAAALNAMSLNELQSYYTSRMAQLASDQQQLGISAQILTALCARLQKLQTQCVSSNDIIPPSGGIDPNCTSVIKSIAAPGASAVLPPKFTVALTDASGNPFQADGQYILVANGLYQSTPFGAGPATISFAYKGGGKVSSAEIMQINNFELRRAEDTVGGTYITGGNAKELPAIETLNVQLKFGNVPLASGPLVSETNDKYIKYRYLLNLATISTNATSSDCTVQQAEIDNIKKSVINAAQASSNQAAAVNVFSQTTNPVLPSKEKMIPAILDAQTKIAAMDPDLEAYMMKLTGITTKLQTNQAISCHASEPIVQLSIQIQGKVNDPKSVTATSDGACPVIGKVGGQGSLLSVDLGSAVTVNIDTLKAGIGGAPWIGPVSEQALVSNIEFLRLGKLAVTIDDLGPKCTSGIMAVTSSCTRICQETDTFSITGVKILLDTPSVTGFVIYDKQGLDVVLGSALYSSSAVMSWNDPNFRANPHWLDLMYDIKCGQAN